MPLAANRTKIVCTIGPASEPLPVLRAMLEAGMNVARLNFSHGTFDEHAARIRTLRQASEEKGKPLAILADLPGPKIRIGELGEEPIEVEAGDALTLTTEEIVGDASRMSISLPRLPQVVKPGDVLYLNDGFLELEVQSIEGQDVRCRVRVGGELRSRKGVNLPDIDLGVTAFTPRDRECLRFALSQGVDAVSQSFVEGPDDIRAVRDAAREEGYEPFVLAKIERTRALERFDEILEEVDGLMVARGDLGVEIPIQRIAAVQKDLIFRANVAGKPVITATQMLESMTYSRRPTRAEATDVANAILDGTDAVMLSGESAVGNYPVDCVRMLASIASSTEPLLHARADDGVYTAVREEGVPDAADLVALSVVEAVDAVEPAALFVPTRSGTTARHLTRFRLPVWVTAVSEELSTVRALQFSYGVQAIHAEGHPSDWRAFAAAWLQAEGREGEMALLVEGPSRANPEANHRMEVLVPYGARLRTSPASVTRDTPSAKS